MAFVLILVIFVVFVIGPLLTVFAYTTAAGISLCTIFVGSRRTTLLSVLAAIASVAVTAAIAIPLTTWVLPQLPDFSAPADGGLGMIYNLVCKIAAMLLVPAASCFVVGLVLAGIAAKAESKNSE